MAIVFDTANATGGNSAGGDDQLDLPITVAAGSDRILLLFLVYYVDADNQFTVSVTRSGSPFTKVGNTSTYHVGGSERLCSEIWYLIAPAVNSDSILINYTLGNEPPYQMYSAITATGVEQSSSGVRGYVVNASASNNPTVTAPSVTGEVIVDSMAALNAPVATVGAGQTQIDMFDASFLTSASSYQAGGAGVMDWTLDSSQPWATAAIVLTQPGLVATKTATDSLKIQASEVATKFTATYTPTISGTIGGYSVPLKVNTLEIQREVGQPASCEFTVINPLHAIVLGDVVVINWTNSQGTVYQIFRGMVESFKKTCNHLGNYLTYDISCVDFASILARRKVLQTDFVIINEQFDFTQAAINTALLRGDGDTSFFVYIMDNASVVIPQFSAKIGTSAMECFTELAAAMGCTFYTDGFALYFVSTANPSAPMTILDNVMENVSIREERDDYRNVQYVYAKGTPSSSATTDPVTSLKRDINQDQIDHRKLIEGGSGRYEDVLEVTHPSSNDQATVDLFAQSVSKIMTRTGGTFRKFLTCQVRDTTGIGLRAGQLASVSSTIMGIASSSWIIQSVTLRDEDGKNLICNLELSETNNIRRYLDSWLRIVKKGQVAITAPDLIVNNQQVFTASGTFNVPAGVTELLITCIGSGAGGGGAINPIFTGGGTGLPTGFDTDGGQGGNGGKALALVAVTPLEALTVNVGNAGSAGAGGTVEVAFASILSNYVAGSNGTDGGNVNVKRGGTTLIEAIGGKAGRAGTVSGQATAQGADGAQGGGTGDGVTVGGGARGGNRDIYVPQGTSPEPAAEAGIKGRVIIEWFV